MIYTMQSVREELLKLAEEDYKKFAAKLIPTNNNLLGIRLPKLRHIARQIASSPYWSQFLQEEPSYFEEIMLQGMVIGFLKEPFDVIINQIELFIPKIDNWSVCDSFVTGLTITNKHKEEMWDFIAPLFFDERPYAVRFAVVMAQRFYVDSLHIDTVFSLLNQVDASHYYVMMAVAWAISTFFIYLPNETTPFLKKHRFDKTTFNTAIQKIIDSKRVRDEDKNFVRILRQK